MDRGAWKATVHGAAKSRTGLSGFTFTFRLGNLLWVLELSVLENSVCKFLWYTCLQFVGSLLSSSMVRETQVLSLGWEDPLEKEVAIHSSTIAWKIPWTKEPGRL